LPFFPVFFYEPPKGNQGLLQEVQQAHRAQAKAVQARQGKGACSRHKEPRKENEGLQGKTPFSGKSQKTEQKAGIPGGMHCMQSKTLLRNTQKNEKSRAGGKRIKAGKGRKANKRPATIKGHAKPFGQAAQGQQN
jgi:hypothetical protein